MFTDKKIEELIESTNENLCSFVCGIIANIPIAILVNLMDYSIAINHSGISIFIIRLLLLFSSTIMCFRMIQFTILVISIKEESRNEHYVEAKNKKMQERVAEELKNFKKYIYSFLLFAIIFIILIIITLVINNAKSIQPSTCEESSASYSTVVNY